MTEVAVEAPVELASIYAGLRARSWAKRVLQRAKELVKVISNRRARCRRGVMVEGTLRSASIQGVEGRSDG